VTVAVTLGSVTAEATATPTPTCIDGTRPSTVRLQWPRPPGAG
jgi:hypothetical protein